MSDEAKVGQQPETGAEAEGKKDMVFYLDRIWTEIKEISSQIEQETRRGGRIARLRFDLRGLRRDADEAASRLGHAVYDAHMAAGKEPSLKKVDGYAAMIDRIAGIQAMIAAKEDEVAELQAKEKAEAAAAE